MLHNLGLESLMEVHIQRWVLGCDRYADGYRMEVQGREMDEDLGLVLDYNGFEALHKPMLLRFAKSEHDDSPVDKRQAA